MLNIPIISTSRKCILDKSYFIGKSGVYLQTWENKRKLFVGFSVADNEITAVNGSKFELLERLLATYDMNQLRLQKYPYLKLLRWHGMKKCGEIHASEVMFGSATNWSSKIKDASGLGLGKSLKSAADHAAYELIERHILSSIWYFNDVKLYLISSYNCEKYQFSFYAINSYISIPFALCLITSNNQDVFIVGSAFSYSLELAIEKSKREAIMMLDSYLNGDNRFPQSNRVRIDSTRDKAFFSDRYNHFNTKMVSNNNTVKFFDLTTICKELNLDIESIFVSPIYAESGYHVVRAVSDLALKLPDLRLSKYALNNPIDPFC